MSARGLGQFLTTPCYSWYGVNFLVLGKWVDSEALGVREENTLLISRKILRYFNT